MALQLGENGALGKKISAYAFKKGMYELDDPSGTNITVQIFDTAQLKGLPLHPDLAIQLQEPYPLLINMDYAFGEQAYETMDELLKAFAYKGKEYSMPIASISIMGKAGILRGGKGDILLPSAHIFEGTADNYPLENEFSIEDFTTYEGQLCEGPMITVLEPLFKIEMSYLTFAILPGRQLGWNGRRSLPKGYPGTCQHSGKY